MIPKKLKAKVTSLNKHYRGYKSNELSHNEKLAHYDNLDSMVDDILAMVKKEYEDAIDSLCDNISVIHSNALLKFKFRDITDTNYLLKESEQFAKNKVDNTKDDCEYDIARAEQVEFLVYYINKLVLLVDDNIQQLSSNIPFSVNSIRNLNTLDKMLNKCVKLEDKLHNKKYRSLKKANALYEEFKELTIELSGKLGTMMCVAVKDAMTYEDTIKSNQALKERYDFITYMLRGGTDLLKGVTKSDDVDNESLEECVESVMTIVYIMHLHNCGMLKLLKEYYPMLIHDAKELKMSNTLRLSSM